jgi:HEAT repeat protein
MIRAAAVLLVLLSPAVAGEPAPVAELLGRLDSPEPRVRSLAAIEAARRVEPEVVERLLAMARGDPSSGPREAAIAALGPVKDARVFPLLAAISREDGGRAQGPRRAALAALGETGDPRAFDLLMEDLARPEWAPWAAEGLGRLGDARAYEAIERLYGEGIEDPWLSSSAPAALLRLDGPRAEKLLLERFPAVPAGARHHLVTLLGERGGAAVRTRMVELLTHAEGPVRTAAAAVLERAGDTSCTAALLRLLSGDRRDRQAIVSALAGIGDATAAPDLAAALRKESEVVVRVLLAGTLGRLGDRRAVADLLPLLADEGVSSQPKTISSIWRYPWNVRVRSVAVWAIRTLVDGAAPFPVEDLSSFPTPAPLADEDAEVHRLTGWWDGHREDPAYRFPR